MILRYDSVAGTFTFFNARPCSIDHLSGHLLVVMIDLNMDATGAANSTGNSIISLQGRSAGTPVERGFFAALMAFYT